ncbi:MAG: hypothetical protein IJU96_00095 [Clostridia bacterium]|nr:hypothetical protein [Clostridia bacterium]
MKKKIPVIVAAALAVTLAAVLFCALAPCVNGLTPFQAAGVKHFLKENPFRTTDPEKGAAISIAAGVGTNGYERNTYVGSLIEMESSPNYIEVNLVPCADGRLVLADSYFDVTEDSVDAYRVAKKLVDSTKNTSLLVNVAEYTSLNAVSALLAQSSRFGSAVIRGVDEDTIDLVRGYFPGYTLLCEYSRQNKLSLSKIKAAGADGVYCSASMLSAHFARRVHKAGLVLWVDCGGNTYQLVKAMNMVKVVDGLVTTNPSLALHMKSAWSYDDFKKATA